MCDCLTLSKVTLTHCSGIFFSFSLFILLLSAAVERAGSLPELTPAQRNKLRHLSIISLASNLKVLVHSFPLCSFHREV